MPPPPTRPSVCPHLGSIGRDARTLPAGVSSAPRVGVGIPPSPQVPGEETAAEEAGSACWESGQVGVGPASRSTSLARVSSGLDCPLGTGRVWVAEAQGPTDCRSSGAETLVSTGRQVSAAPLLTRRVVTAVLLVLQRTLVEPGPGRCPAALAGQALRDWGPAREGDSLCRLALSCSLALASASSLCLQPSACLPDPMWPGVPAAPSNQPSTVLARQDRCSAARMRPCSPPALLTPAWCFSCITACSRLFGRLCSSVVLARGCSLSPPGPLFKPDHNLRAWCGLRKAPAGPLVPRGAWNLQARQARAGLFPGAQLVAALPTLQSPGLCPVEWARPEPSAA